MKKQVEYLNLYGGLKGVSRKAHCESCVNCKLR